MTATSPIRSSLEAHAPALAETFARQLRNRFAAMIEKFGPALRGIYNSEHAKFGAVAQKITDRDGDRINSAMQINEQKLSAFCDAMAAETVIAWLAKIEAKIGDLDDATAWHVSGHTYAISGTRDGHQVTITQDMIVNVSGRGTLFNQWPSRIKVDGKAISARAYDQMFKRAA